MRARARWRPRVGRRGDRVEPDQGTKALQHRAPDPFHLQEILEGSEASEPLAQGEDGVGALVADAGEPA